jgi:hypothetical protein
MARPAQRAVLLAALLLGLATAGLAQVRPATATAADGQRVDVGGRRVVLVEPDIELTLVTAGGLQEPREEWTRDARRFYADAVRATLAESGTPQAPDFDIPDDLDPDSRLGQVVRLNEAVALSISQFLLPGGALATKRDANGKPRLDWTLGDGVVELHETTGADYALFTYVRDSYASGGRTALRFTAADPAAAGRRFSLRGHARAGRRSAAPAG